MKTKWLLVLGILLAFWGCNGGPEISPEEKARQEYVKKLLSDADGYLGRKDCKGACEELQKGSQKYPDEPSIYKKMAEAYLMDFKAQREKNEFEGQVGVKAVEKGYEYYKNLKADKHKDEFPQALTFLGDLLQEIFPYIPIKEYQDALSFANDLANRAEGSSREAKYCVGVCSLYAYQITKAKQLLAEASNLQAGKLLTLVTELEGAEAISDIGKRLAFREKINRGDAGAFFFHEMKGITFAPENYRSEWNGEEIRDLENFWAHNEVKYCLKIGVLKLLGNKVFQPNITMTRYEFAFLLTETLRLRGENNVDTKYTEATFFHDPPNKFPEGSSRCLFAVQEGFMPIGSDQMFYPDIPVKGSLFISAVDKLRKRINKK